MAPQVEARDAMQFVNEQDAATLERFIERLELRRKDPTFVAYREAYLQRIDLPRTAAVLELAGAVAGLALSRTRTESPAFRRLGRSPHTQRSLVRTQPRP
jgi:hypothetical protein